MRPQNNLAQILSMYNRAKLLLLFCCILCFNSHNLFAQLIPSQAFSFFQNDYYYEEDTVLNSTVGVIEVDVDTLNFYSDLDSGYINVVSFFNGWVVQNLPIPKQYPYSSLSTTFYLDSVDGNDYLFLEALITYDPLPLMEPPLATDVPFFDVGDKIVFAEGYTGTGTAGAIFPPNPLFFNWPMGPTIIHIQPNHPNLETARNQCNPMAVANSLKWLNDTYGNITIPDPHMAGLGNGGGTLVGMLEDHMGRAYTNRRVGSGVGASQGLKGKLKYLAEKNITSIDVKHMGSDFIEPMFGTTPYSETVMGTTVASTGLGNVITADRLIQEIREGEDVELGYLWKDRAGRWRGHFVELFGAGTILGKPYIFYMHDTDQSDDTKGLKRDHSRLEDTDGNGQLNLVGGTHSGANITVFYSQSPKTSSSTIDMDPNDESKNIALEVFPNPAKDYFQIQFTSQEREMFSLHLLNVTGRAVKKIFYGYVQKNAIKDILVDISDIPNGLYFISIQNKNGFLMNRKVTIIH